MEMLLVKWPNETISLIASRSLDEMDVFSSVDCIGDPTDPETHIRVATEDTFGESWVVDSTDTKKCLNTRLKVWWDYSEPFSFETWKK